MSRQPHNSNKHPSSEPSDGNFFLPDLCTPQATLALLVLAEMLALLIAALQRGLYPFDWLYFSLLSLFCLMNFLISAALLCAIRRFLAALNLITASSLMYLLILGVAALATVVGQWLLGLSSITGVSYDPNQILINVFVAAVVAGIGLRYLYLHWLLRAREHSEMAARIEALQARIKPHFLFNSLNTIASLIEDDRAKAERAVEDLSALFRANLQNSEALSTWGAERELCERYLRIESARLGDRLRVSWQTDSIPNNTAMLSLSLQPLIENAIVHGLQWLPAGGDIIIQAKIDQNVCEISVQNPVPEKQPEEGNRLASENLRHRLQSLYGEKASLQMQENDQTFVVTLRFPVNSFPVSV